MQHEIDIHARTSPCSICEQVQRRTDTKSRTNVCDSLEFRKVPQDSESVDSRCMTNPMFISAKAKFIIDREGRVFKYYSPKPQPQEYRFLSKHFPQAFLAVQKLSKGASFAD